MQVTTAIGKGGTNGVLTAGQMTQLFQRMGSTNLELCYNPKLHGYSSATMHSRCDNRGKTLTLMRRNSNGQVFGGYVGRTLNKVGWSGPCTEKPWLFTVKSGQVKFLNYAGRGRQCYYMANSYGMTWGGGHDLHCSSDLESCYANPSSYTHARTELSGQYSWKHRREAGNKGMVYEIYLIK